MKLIINAKQKNTKLNPKQKQKQTNKKTTKNKQKYSARYDMQHIDNCFILVNDSHRY